MKRAAIGLLSLCFSAAACGRAGTSPASGGTPTPLPTSGVERTVGIYASVIRQLVTKDANRGGGPALKAVYVIDGAVQGAENPELPLYEQMPQSPFDPAVKDGLTKALAELPPLTFVKDRSRVVAGSGPGHVINDGVLVTLGPISGDGTIVRVGNSSWMNGLAGQWLTYVVRGTGKAWSIAGTDGPTAIS